MSTTITPGVLAVVLITQLGSPHYRERAEASRELYQLTPLVVPYLEAAQRHEDMEVSQRSTLILTSYYGSIADRMAENLRPKNWTHLPWICRLPDDYPNRKAIVDCYLQQAQGQVGRKGPPSWEDYRLATRLYLRELIMSRQRPEQLLELLEHMAEGEREWIRQNGGRYSPPLEVPK